MSSKATFLKDYQKPKFKIHSIDLDVQIYEEKTIVTSVLDVEKLDKNAVDLFLDGEELSFISLSVNSKDSEYDVLDDGLRIKKIPDRAKIEIQNEINPYENFKLEGFYKSGDILCTQCESEGFRRITYYLDRPDVMASFSCKLTADKNKFPYLLSNGNLIESAELNDNRHYALWKDPHLKPCYLFAMVAGDLAKVTDEFITKSGKKVDIEFFVQHGNESKTEHAIKSLKNAMIWDEEKFGLEYDLDIYMVVAVDSFNAGAMENKGLNIFNSQYVLADQETATDQNFLDVEGVIAHEYFHNWTGNRVTCRDWFQLTLKEGLTVYRDQEFSADMNSRPVQRMFDVRVLKEHQYAEDSGPTSHPIRPEKYVEINNFYTTTVYNKGAEVIRMFEMFIGKEKFRKGIDIYFKNFDGQAVTTEDFVWAMEKASGMDFSQFKRWYSQSGTPTINFQIEQDLDKKQVLVKSTQSYKKETNGLKHKAFQIPVDFALISQDGKEIKSASKILNINKAEQEFVFENITEKVVPSILRRFSAPVKINASLRDDELIHLARFDTDEFNRYDAVQRLFRNIILDKYNHNKAIDYKLIFDFIEELIENSNIDASLKAEMLTLPAVSELVEDCDIADYIRIHKIRESIKNDIANSLYDHIESHYLKLFKSVFDYDISPQSMANRKLQNVYLNFLSYKSTKLVKAQYKMSTNMTDSLAAFSLICNSDDAERQDYINAFADKWKNDFLVMNKWFMAQSTAEHDDCLNQIQLLLKSEYYDAKNPNNIRSLLRGFARNHAQFHRIDTHAYQMMADQVLEIDSFNSSIASNISLAFRKYSVLPEENKALMKVELERILSHKGLSKDVEENISRIYKG